MEHIIASHIMNHGEEHNIYYINCNMDLEKTEAVKHNY